MTTAAFSQNVGQVIFQAQSWKQIIFLFIYAAAKWKSNEKFRAMLHPMFMDVTTDSKLDCALSVLGTRLYNCKCSSSWEHWTHPLTAWKQQKHTWEWVGCLRGKVKKAGSHQVLSPGHLESYLVIIQGLEFQNICKAKINKKVGGGN